MYRPHRTGLAAAASCFLFVGCGGTVAQYEKPMLPPPEPATSQLPDWFPLGIGHVWVYDAGGTEVTFQIVRKERIRGADCYVMRRSIGADAIEYAMSTDGGSANLHRVQDRVFDPPLREFELPPDPKAPERRYTGKLGRDAVTVRTKVVDVGDVDVPAGKFRAYCIVENMQFADATRSGTTRFWLAENVGIVKLEAYSGTEKLPQFTWKLKRVSAVGTPKAIALR